MKKRSLGCILAAFMLIISILNTTSIQKVHAASPDGLFTWQGMRINGETGTYKCEVDSHETVRLSIKVLNIHENGDVIPEGQVQFYYSDKNNITSITDPDIHIILGAKTSFEKLTEGREGFKAGDYIACSDATIDLHEWDPNNNIYFYAAYEKAATDTYSAMDGKLTNGRVASMAYKANIAINSTDLVKTYGDEIILESTVSCPFYNPSITNPLKGKIEYTLTNTVTGETAKYSANTDPSTGVGSVKISGSDIEKCIGAGEYTVSAVFKPSDKERVVGHSATSTLVVNKRDVSIKLDDVELLVSQVFPEEYSYSVTAGSLVGSDKIEGIKVTPSIANTLEHAQGTLDVVIDPAMNPNYNVTATGANITVIGENTSPTINVEQVENDLEDAYAKIKVTVDDLETPEQLKVTIGKETLELVEGVSYYYADSNGRYEFTVTDNGNVSTSMYIDITEPDKPSLRQKATAGDGVNTGDNSPWALTLLALAGTLLLLVTASLYKKTSK